MSRLLRALQRIAGARLEPTLADAAALGAALGCAGFTLALIVTGHAP